MPNITIDDIKDKLAPSCWECNNGAVEELECGLDRLIEKTAILILILLKRNIITIEDIENLF